jgi:outer membrane protein assembly factor BamB
VALDPATGRTLWDSGKGKDMGFAAPVIARLDGKRCALFHMSERLYAVDPADGKVLWSSEFGTGYRTHCSDPVVSGDLVFISSGDDGGELLRVSDGQARRVWKNKNLSTFTGSAVLIGGHLYGHETAGYKTANQQLRCIDMADGAVKWGEGGFGQGSVIASGDRLIVLGEKGELSIVRADPLRFSLLARTQAIGGKCWTAPTLSDGRIFARNAKGDVVCLDVAPAKSAAIPPSSRSL